jgi:RimJ/RimL family protein N-acetyltransferase
MQTAPREALDVGDVMIDEDFVAEVDRQLVEAGRTRWTLFVRSPEGACVGGTEVRFEPWQPATVLQGNTGIDPRRRGLGLAKWAKAAMVERIRREWPQANRIRTDNASSNAAMLAINEALGYKVISTWTEWQIDLDDLRRSLTR